MQISVYLNKSEMKIFEKLRAYENCTASFLLKKGLYRMYRELKNTIQMETAIERQTHSPRIMETYKLTPDLPEVFPKPKFEDSPFEDSLENL